MAKKVLYSVVGVVVLGFVLLLIIGLNTPQPIKQAQESAPVQNPVVVATSSAPDKQKVAAILSASTDHYVSLLSSAKTVLGTTQYADANAGLKALNDPSSAASQLGSFRTNTCLKNDPGTNAMSAYQEADNLYSGTSPDALGNWNEDINNAASDICLWAGDAVSWQIKEVTTTKLRADEQKVTDDITKARADIQSLSK
ncbi:MAG: hypothetical protein WCK48_00670 [bacterium]